MPQLKDKMRVDTMLTSGSRAAHSHHMDQMQAHMEPKITTRVKLDDCGDVLQDAPEAFAYNLLLFCQGLGLCQYIYRYLCSLDLAFNPFNVKVPFNNSYTLDNVIQLNPEI